MMLSDVCLSDVCRVHPVGGRRVRPAGWMVRIGWSGLAWPAWLKAAAVCFRCRPRWGILWGHPPTACLWNACNCSGWSNCCLSEHTQQRRIVWEGIMSLHGGWILYVFSAL